MSDVIISPEEQLYLEMLDDLNSPQGEADLIGLTTRLHEKQVECLKSLYNKGKSLLIINCGRKFGKSELAAYALWRHALLHPGSACYYIAPEASHGRKILWDTRRLQKFLGTNSNKYIDGSPNNLEMKIRFKNGSFIQIFGSENWSAANGLSPSIVVYDEFKAFNPQFHVEMDPNRTAKNAPLIIIGTMPKVGDRNKEQYEALLEYAKGNNKRSAVHTYTTFDNPINMLPERRPAIEEQIAILRARGEEDVVQREYYSKIVPGGSRAIFPMLGRSHVKPHHELVDEISRDRKKLDWYLVADPGTTTCFAALFVAMNPYTKKVYILDEIYEKDQSQTSSRRIFPHMEAKMKDLFPEGDIYEDWFKVADEAAAWFMTEILDQYGVYFQPTNKVHNKKDEGLSLLKDQLLYNLISISERCEFLYKEMIEYAKDNNGNIPKKNDHLIDCIFGEEEVSTTKGLKKIKEVVIGDRVYTNKGIDSVTDSWFVGERDCLKLTFSNGKSIICTHDHKVFTKNRGFVEARSLTDCDTFDTMCQEDLLWNVRQLYIEVLNLGDIQTVSAGQTGVTLKELLHLRKKISDICIDIFTNKRSEKYLKDIIYITLTTILSIMMLVTLLVLKVKNTLVNIIKGLAHKLRETISIGLGTLQKSGIPVKQVRNGIQKIQRICGLMLNGLKKSALYVIKPIKPLNPLLTEVSTVTKTVRLLHSEDVGKLPVYDITTKNHNRFYVNGTLVHNCARYFNGASHYSMKEVVEGVKQKSDYEEIRKGRFKTLDDEENQGEDWIEKIME